MLAEGNPYVAFYLVFSICFCFLLLLKTILHFVAMIVDDESESRTENCVKFFQCLAVWTFAILSWVQMRGFGP